jgi:hypothetical protein
MTNAFDVYRPIPAQPGDTTRDLLPANTPPGAVSTAERVQHVLVDTVFYSAYPRVTEGEVWESLVGTDGYPSDIVVIRNEEYFEEEEESEDPENSER